MEVLPRNTVQVSKLVSDRSCQSAGQRKKRLTSFSLSLSLSLRADLGLVCSCVLFHVEKDRLTPKHACKPYSCVLVVSSFEIVTTLFKRYFCFCTRSYAARKAGGTLDGSGVTAAAGISNSCQGPGSPCARMHSRKLHVV